MSRTTERLHAGERLLLDGGNGQELGRRWQDDRPGLWGGQALMDAPETVVGVHRDFIDAGADVITTHTYTTTRRRLGEAWARYTDRATALAQRARQQSGRDHVAIAGCLPPLFGSYQPERVPPVSELEPLYREQADRLAPHVDCLLAETLSTASEAVAAARAARAVDRPLWVSWTIADDATGRLRSGESIADAVAAIDGLGVEAVLLNCSLPESIDVALPELAAHAARPFGAYANGFTAIPAGFDVADGANLPDKREDLDPARYAGAVEPWLAQGVRIIGGCCEVGPAHIARLASLLATAPEQQGR